MVYNLQLLVVDDVRTERFIVRSMLEMAGVRRKMIVFADSGIRAIEFLLSNSDGVDAIFMDVNMPVMNGVDAAKIIKKTFPKLKIVGVSSNDPLEHEPVFDDYVQKPFRKKQFQDLLAKMFRPHMERESVEDFQDLLVKT